MGFLVSHFGHRVLDLGLHCRVLETSSTGRQAADLHSVRLDPLALPEGIGAVPAHHLPLLDAFSAGGRALYRSRKAKNQTMPGAG